MARALKWILIVVAVVVVLLVAAVVAVTVLVDPNDYKDEISHAVEERTGRKLTIAGDIDLTFFPWLGLKLGATQLSDAPGFGDEPFARIENVQLAVAVWPLLSERRLVLDKIVIDGLGLRLIRDKQGRGNWEDLAERFASEEAQAPAESPPPSEEKGGGLPVTIESRGGLELKNATVLWDDRQAGAQYLVSPFSLTVSELDLEAPIPVRAQWILKATDAPEVAGELTARLVYNQQANTLAVQQLAVDTTLSGEQVPSGKLAAKLRGEVQADLEAQRYAVSQTTLELAGIAVNLAAEASMQGEELLANATVTLPPFNARESLRQLQIDLPQMSDPKALTRVGMSTKLQYSNKGLVLEELKAQLDDSTLTGQAQLPSFDPLTARFQLAMDRIDLDRYLPHEQEAPAAPAPAGAPAGEAELPLDMLRKLNLDGALSVGQMIVKKLHITDVKMKITARDGIIRAEPLATLYQGHVRGELTLDATTDDPKFSMRQQLAGVQAGSLLEDLVGIARILGVADLNLAVNMHGAGVEDWLKSASGTGSFKLSDGAISGINIAEAIQGARAKLANEPAAATAESGTTPFNVLQGTLKIDEGLVLNRDFDLSSSLLKVVGDGQFSLLTQAVDYTLNVSLLEPLLKSDNKLLGELRNVPIPVHVTGNYHDLKVGVNLQQALEQAGKARLQEEVQERKKEVEGKVQEKVQEKVQDKLQDLLKKRN